MAQIQGLLDIEINTPDIEGSVRFYAEGLGLELLAKDEARATLKTPDGILIRLVKGEAGPHDTSGFTHICLNTYDVDKAFARALEYGAVRSRESDPEPYTYKDLRMAFVRTAAGEEIEFWGIMRPSRSFGEDAPEGKYIKNFVHVAFVVPDMPASVRFYEALGAKLKVDWEWGCSMTLPDRRELELFTEGSYNEKPQNYTRFGFVCDSPAELTKKAAEAGGKSLGPGGDGELAAGLAGERILFAANSIVQFAANGASEGAPQPLPDLFADVPKEERS